MSSQFIHLFNASSPKVLDILGGSIEANKYIHVYKRKDRHNDNQRFVIEPVGDDSGLFYVKIVGFHMAGTLVMATSEHQDKANIMTMVKTGSMREKWKVEFETGKH